MKLYHHPMSSNARRAVMTALILEAPVELELVDLQKRQQREPEYLALNPNGRVPTLVDGDFVLWESLAIMEYLAGSTPGQTLFPREGRARANVQRWLFWTASHWSPTTAQIVFERFLKGMLGQGEPNAYALERGEQTWGQLADVLDGALAKSRWVAGEAMTLADLAIAAPLMYRQPAKLPLEGRANIERWFGQVSALEAWKKTEPPMG
jgi:glutathione S-transferase